MQLKAFILLTKYRSRRLAKKIGTALPFALFLLSFLLFAYILFPRLIDRLISSDIIFNREGEYLISGVVIKQRPPLNGVVRFEAVQGAAVEIGGYKTRTDETGAYKLRFSAPGGANVAIVVTRGTTSQVVFHVRLPRGVYRLDHDLVIP